MCNEAKIAFSSIQDAVSFLSNTQGNILLDGKMEFVPFFELPEGRERIYLNVPMTDVAVLNNSLQGIIASHVVSLPKSCSKALFGALLQDLQISFLVSEVQDHMEQAQSLGVSVIDTRRFEALPKEPLDTAKTRVSILGIGMGSTNLLTREAEALLQEADCVIGAKRMVDAVGEGKKQLLSMDPYKISDFIQNHPELQKIVVVVSGDTGFYSVAKKLIPKLSRYQPKVYPGISSLQYFCARLGMTWDDAKVVSLHGRKASVASIVTGHPKVFFLMGGDGAVHNICKELCENDFGTVRVSVGERLSYPNERITTGTAEELISYSFSPLSVVLVTHERPVPVRRVGLPDEAFLRYTGEGNIVPMTKSEVRAISLAKLQLDHDSVVYDIGAGSGSVAIEMAGVCSEGQVYAIECKALAVELIEKNKRRFCLPNLTVIEGMAPKACVALPTPTHAFIGGTSGNMREIIEMLLEKNPHIRIVMNLITLESLAEMTSCIKELGLASEVLSISIAKARKIGNYHLMNGQNPITIATLWRSKANEGKG